MMPLIRSLRPSQWAKNVFVLAAPAFARRLADPTALIQALVAVAAFCAAASAVYLVNDLLDRDEDRRHPTKRLRPLAAGTLRPGTALAAAAVLAIAAAAAAAWLGLGFSLVLAAYLVINALYSWRLKRVVIVDVMAISAGFVLRVLAGGAAVGAEVSPWLLVCTLLVALFLAVSKRRHELVLLAGQAPGQRQVLSHYGERFLDQMINVVTASTLTSYAIYTLDPRTVERFGSDRLVYTVPLVLFGIFRFLYLVYQRDEARNPTELILRDPPSLVNLGLWAAAVLWVVYG